MEEVVEVAVFPPGLGPLAALPERGWGLPGLGLGALPGGRLAMAVKHWRRGGGRGEEEEKSMGQLQEAHCNSSIVLDMKLFSIKLCQEQCGT